MGNEHHMAYGARFLFGTRPMIDFESGNEHYGGAFRYFGLGAIFPTQSLRAAGIWILSTQFFRLLLVLIVQFVAMSLRTGFFKFITQIIINQSLCLLGSKVQRNFKDCIGTQQIFLSSHPIGSPAQIAVA